MKKDNIDSLANIDFTSLTMSDIEIKHGTHISRSSGSGYQKKRTSRSGYQTEIGDIRVDIWRILAEKVIEHAGEDEILNRLLSYVDSLPWMKDETRESRREKALDLHIRRIFDRPEWVHFIPFNESWRPEVLSDSEIVWVTTSCCPIPGRVTLQQIRNYTGQKTVNCPNCGRFSPFQQIEEDKDNG